MRRGNSSNDHELGILRGSDTESISSDRTAFSGPLNAKPKRASKKFARFASDLPKRSNSVSRGDDDDYVEITLDIRDDSVAVHSVQQAPGHLEDPELALLTKNTLETSLNNSNSHSFFRTTSSRIKSASRELRRVFSRRPSVTVKRFDRTSSAAVHALKGLKFIATKTAAWPAVEQRFEKLSDDSNGVLLSSKFWECLGMNKESKDFADQLFRALAHRNNISGDAISKDQLRLFWEQISDDSFDAKLQVFFDMVDKDEDGRVTEEEVAEIINLSASANKLSNIQKQAKEYAALIMEELDPDNAGYIMIENLEMLLLQAPNQSVRIGDSRILSQMLSQKLKPTKESNLLVRWSEKIKYFVLDNWQRLWIMMLWLSICGGLFTYKFIQYRNKAAYEVMSYCVCIAKGGAETLKFNMALILLPVCRNTITWLRNKTKLGVVVPFDDNLNFHKVIASGIVVGVLLHAGAHLTCDFPRLIAADEETYEPMIPYFGEQTKSYWTFVKGIEGVTGIVMVVLMAIAFTLATPWFRRNKLNLPKFLKKLTGFNAFWYSHHLFIIVYALLIVHGIKLYLTKIWYQKTIISFSASANKLSTIQKQAKEYAALIMEELDPDDVGYIMIKDLEMVLLQAPNQMVRGDSRILSQIISQQLKPTKESNPLIRWSKKIKYFIVDNWQRLWIMMLWLSICGGLFTYKFIQYRNKAAFDVMNYCICIAKGGAETLKFNMALILLPVCRNTITWLRNKTKLGVVVPFDDNLNFHKVIASGISVGVLLHAGAHLTCDFPLLLAADEETYEPMIPYFGEQPKSYWWFMKGVEEWTGIVMVVLMAIAFTLATPWFRRNKLKLPKFLKKLTGFNAFWYSHHLFIIVYALLIVHGIKLYLTKIWYQKTTWMYLVVPILLYASERLVRTFRSSIKPVKIVNVGVYPENCLALHMTKPQGFKYKSGQYMFVNCRAVSPFEWHPFSITSAPGDEYLSVHIRTLGDWTSKLKTVFSKECKPPMANKSDLLRAEGGDSGNIVFPKILIDGPYGAPSQDYKKYDIVFLVGLGIGATPMISILKDIINNMKSPDHNIENNHITNNSKGFRTRKAYFYWVTREQGSFEWFKEIMNEVSELDEEGIIELHNYCTSVYEESDARVALITMLQSLHHAKNGVDAVSGTRVKSHFAKPKWRQVYKRIAVKHPDKTIGVFYCGLRGPIKELTNLALDFSHKTSTKFDFHKEIN